MTQILLNTLNNNINEMMNKTSLNGFEKPVKNLDKDFMKKDFTGMDKSSSKESVNFDKVFNKQLEKESANRKVEDKQVEDKQVVETNFVSNTKVETENTKSSDGEISQSVDEIKTLGDIKFSEKTIDLKNIMNTIAQKIESVVDCNYPTETLATLKDLLSQVAEESSAESSLDLTLARDINELINQLQKVAEKFADKIETSTEDSCTAVVEDLISNIEKEFEILSTPDREECLDSSEQNPENVLEEDLNVLKEQLLAYVNKVDISQVKDFEAKNLLVEPKSLEQVETVDIEFCNEIIDLSTGTVEEVAVNNSTNKVQQSEIEIPLDEESLKELNIESIKAESQTSENGSSFMEHQTPEEHSVRASLNQDFESFEIKLDKPFETQNVQQAQIKPTEISPSKIIEQITKQMEGLQNSSKVNIVLNPESLGKVTIQLIKTGEGLSAQFTVASQEVKDMLMKGLDGLKETLMAQGVGVDNVSVKLNDIQKSSYNPDWTEQEDSRGGNKEQGRSNKEQKHKEVFEQMMAQTDEENGNV